MTDDEAFGILYRCAGEAEWTCLHESNADLEMLITGPDLTPWRVVVAKASPLGEALLTLEKDDIMTSFGFVADPGDSAQTFYRCHLVSLGLQELGHEAHVGDVVTQHPDGGPLILANIRTGVNHGAPDVLVHRLWTEDTTPMIEDARASGQTVLFDMDDDIWHWPDWNPAGQYEGKPGQLSRKVMEAHLQCCDAVLTSSPNLAREIRKHTDRTVFESAAPVDARPYPWPKKWHEPLRLVWLGTRDYRGPDFETIAPEIAEIVKENDVEFHWLGAQAVDDTEWMRTLIGPRFHGHNWAPIHTLPSALSYFDLAVVPSVPHQFNACRAANTGLALAAAGIPFCHSAGVVSAYDDAGLGAPFEPGHLAETLVRMEAEKDRISVEQRELVEREWSPKACGGAWITAAKYGSMLHRAEVG